MSDMFRVCFLVCLLQISVSGVSGVAWENCTDTKVTGAALDVNIPSCPHSKQSCQLVQGTTPTVAVTFKTSVDITGCTAKVWGILDTLHVPFPLKQPDGCKSGLTCPLKAGSTVTYHSDVYVNPIYPQVKLEIKWELVDSKGSIIWCITVPAEVVKPSSKLYYKPRYDKYNYFLKKYLKGSAQRKYH